MNGVIIALKEEITSINDISDDVKVYETNFFKYYIFSKNNNNFVLVFSGVGKANSAACTIDLIKTFNVKNILNIGVCGTNKNDIEKNSVTVLSRNYYLDVDATEFGYSFGQVPKELEFFENENEFNNKIKKILKENNIEFKQCYGATIDSFINNKNIDKFVDNDLFEKVSCFDMESCSIKQIASKAKTNTSFIKVISDNIRGKTNEYIETKETWPKTVTKIINLIINNF